MSVKLHGIVGTTHALDRAWPETLDATDPYAGDEVIEYPGRFANYARYSVEERIDEAEHDRWDSVFCESFRGVLRGDEDPVRLAEAARKLQVDLPLTHDRRPPRVAPRVLGEERLSDIVENWVPDIGILGPDRVLGPWADESLPAWLHRLCGRVLCFSPILPPAVRPMGRESKSRPRPPLEVRRVLIAMLRAPPMLWRTEGVEPLLPISDRWLPEGPVSGLPETPSFVGRIYKTPDGWQCCCVLPLPLLPDPGPLQARIHLELMRLRRFERRISWEDVLRDRGEVLYRSVCEQLWLEEDTRSALAACWSEFS